MFVCALLAAATLCGWPGHREVFAAVPNGNTSSKSLRLRVVERLRARRSASQDATQLTMLLESVSAAIRSGITPAAAVAACARAAAESLPAGSSLPGPLQDLAHSAERGDDLAAAWRTVSACERRPALQQVARAWTLSDRLGCGLTESIDATVALLRAQLERERQLQSALAGPRATMQILTGLPVAGTAIAAVIGVPPWRLYAGPVGLISLTLGVALVLAGRRLIRFMTDRMCAPAPVVAS